ncbi:MAG: NUDIX hydrolase [Bifidobacteriaceae bacterium]|nr:NUDIX hydrolase [Bifidobacteriaceae bacterium]
MTQPPAPAEAGGPAGCEVADRAASYPVVRSETVFRGRVWDVVADAVALPGGQAVRREYMDHTGAVAVIAVDDAVRVLLQRQYRHPARAELWEPPAGLLDVAGEPPAATARRELWEEADLEARDWRRLISFNSSPGGSSEVIHVFLARGLSLAPAGRRFARQDEEAALVPAWLGLDEAVGLVMAGALRSPTAVVGILAAAQARSAPGGWDALPPP